MNAATRRDYGQSMSTLDALLARNVRQIRVAMGMTQEEFAEVMEMTQANISRLESAAGFKRMKTLDSALKGAGADPMDLFNKPGEPAADPIMTEIRQLLVDVGPDAREAVLSMLRTISAAQGGSSTQGRRQASR